MNHTPKKRAICSFTPLHVDLRESLTVALLPWATWGICSQLLICPEQSERIAHSHSFDLINLSKWANEQLSDEQMSEFPTLITLLLVWAKLVLSRREKLSFCCLLAKAFPFVLLFICVKCRCVGVCVCVCVVTLYAGRLCYTVNLRTDTRSVQEQKFTTIFWDVLLALCEEESPFYSMLRHLVAKGGNCIGKF